MSLNLFKLSKSKIYISLILLLISSFLTLSFSHEAEYNMEGYVMNVTYLHIRLSHAGQAFYFICLMMPPVFCFLGYLIVFNIGFLVVLILSKHYLATSSVTCNVNRTRT